MLTYVIGIRRRYWLCSCHAVEFFLGVGLHGALSTVNLDIDVIAVKAISFDCKSLSTSSVSRRCGYVIYDSYGFCLVACLVIEGASCNQRFMMDAISSFELECDIGAFFRLNMAHITSNIISCIGRQCRIRVYESFKINCLAVDPSLSKRQIIRIFIGLGWPRIYNERDFRPKVNDWWINVVKHRSVPSTHYQIAIWEGDTTKGRCLSRGRVVVYNTQSEGEPVDGLNVIVVNAEQSHDRRGRVLQLSTSGVGIEWVVLYESLVSNIIIFLLCKTQSFLNQSNSEKSERGIEAYMSRQVQLLQSWSWSL